MGRVTITIVLLLYASKVDAPRKGYRQYLTYLGTLLIYPGTV